MHAWACSGMPATFWARMSNRSIKNLLTSFRNAARGVVYCVNNERNMRIHLVTATYVIVFSRFFHLSQSQFALMLCAVSVVIAMEMVNTAVEALVNLHSPAYDSLARVAKDIAAGAVLVCAAFAAIIGLLLFWDWPVIIGILRTLCTSPLWGVLFLLSVAAAVLFIFTGPVKIKRCLADRLRRRPQEKQ